jgi:hypothetical protein
VAAESLSAVGIVAEEELGESVGGAGSEDETTFTGAGSDAQGREG